MTTIEVIGTISNRLYEQEAAPAHTATEPAIIRPRG